MKRLLIGFGVLAFLIPQYCEGSPIDEKINTVINEVLKELHPQIPNNIATKTLLKLTAAVESDNGRITDNNSSIGIWQLTGTTIKYIQEWLCKNETLCKKVAQLNTRSTFHYHAALAIIYYSSRINLSEIKISNKPTDPEIHNLAAIWKKEYNTWKGSGKAEDAFNKYKLFAERR